MNNSTLIIGASSEIGISLIRSLRSVSDSHIIAHFNSSKDSLINLIEDNGYQNIQLIQANLNSDNDLERLTSITCNYKVTKIVLLAANALEYIRFKDVNWSAFEADLSVSLKSSVVLLKHLLPKMAKAKKGKVVMVLSSCVLGVPPKAMSHYCVSKYAMLGLMKSLASEYSQKNIQINAISPSMIETKFLNKIESKFVELSAYHHPLKRNANLDDVVPLLKFLLSNDSGYINGINIPITGGTSF